MSIAIDLSQLITAEAKASEALAADRDRIKARRDMAIASGITVADMALATDDLSQARIMGAALSAMLDPDYSVQWKTASGFVTLTAPEVIGLATAIRAHVQACFDREAQLLADLDATSTPSGFYRLDGTTTGTWPLGGAANSTLQVYRQTSAGAQLQVMVAGTTANRPTGAWRFVGLQYFDTTLVKPIWWDGTNWKDATGATV